MLATRTLLYPAAALFLALPFDAIAGPAELYIDRPYIPPAAIQANYDYSGGMAVSGTDYFGEGGFLSNDNSPEHPFGFTVTLPDASHGGSVDLTKVYLGNIHTSGVDYPWPQAHASLDGIFHLAIGLANQSGNGFDGPPVYVSGNVQGAINGPLWTGPLLTGGFTGVGTSASLSPFPAPGAAPDLSAAAGLPSPLLDILANPGHLHISGVIESDFHQWLKVTLTFDPPSPVPIPETTTLATLLAGAAYLATRRSRLARRPR